ncbi:UNVERIFIED_CONTAM: hypothetical protein GTU68_045599 [Idotea baltica]|nr:hypothetical protein [Idotea baltica]
MHWLWESLAPQLILLMGE